METNANYVLIGIFTLLVAIGAALFGLFAANYSSGVSWSNYQILFNQSVAGLSNGSPVLYNGVNVGRVAKLQLNPDDVRQVLVTVEIVSDVPIHQDTEASVRLTGLTGSAAIQLAGGSPASPLLKPDPTKPPQIAAVSSPLNRLLASSEDIVLSASKVLKQLEQVFNDQNIEQINATLASLEQFSRTLATPDSAFNQLLQTIATTTNRFDTLLVNIDQGLVQDLPQLKQQLAATLANLESLSGRLDRIIAVNEHELSQVGTAGLQQVYAGLDDIRQLIRQLSELVQQVDNNPSNLLLGGEQPEEYRSQ